MNKFIAEDLMNDDIPAPDTLAIIVVWNGRIRCGYCTPHKYSKPEAWTWWLYSSGFFICHNCAVRFGVLHE